MNPPVPVKRKRCTTIFDDLTDEDIFANIPPKKTRRNVPPSVKPAVINKPRRVPKANIQRRKNKLTSKSTWEMTGGVKNSQPVCIGGGRVPPQTRQPDIMQIAINSADCDFMAQDFAMPTTNQPSTLPVLKSIGNKTRNIIPAKSYNPESLQRNGDNICLEFEDLHIIPSEPITNLDDIILSTPVINIEKYTAQETPVHISELVEMTTPSLPSTFNPSTTIIAGIDPCVPSIIGSSLPLTSKQPPIYEESLPSTSRQPTLYELMLPYTSRVSRPYETTLPSTSKQIPSIIDTSTRSARDPRHVSFEVNTPDLLEAWVSPSPLKRLEPGTTSKLLHHDNPKISQITSMSPVIPSDVLPCVSKVNIIQSEKTCVAESSVILHHDNIQSSHVTTVNPDISPLIETRAPNPSENTVSERSTPAMEAVGNEIDIRDLMSTFAVSFTETLYKGYMIYKKLNR